MRYVTPLLAAAMLVTLSGAPSLAVEAPPSRLVRFGDLDLTKKEDAAILDRRLSIAARRVCNGEAIGTVSGGAWHSRCIRIALANAYAEISARRMQSGATSVAEMLAERSRIAGCASDCPSSPIGRP